MPSQQAEPEQPFRRPSVLTLAIASASSVVAAVVVSRVWGPGTLIGAAATPVIITLVAELLTRPAEKIVVRAPPVATAGQRRPVPEPVPETAASPAPAQGELAALRVHRAQPRPVVVALVAGLLAFMIGALVLTTSELVFGGSAVSSDGQRTTVFGGGTGDRSTTQDAPATPAPTTSTDPQAPTTPTPVPSGPTAVEPTPERTVPEQTTPPASTAPTVPPAAAAPEAGPTTP